MSRADGDREQLYRILDTGLLCHVAVILDGVPTVQPTGYGRDGNTLYIRSVAAAEGLRRAAAEHMSVCVTQLDGIVYGRSAMQFSMNYRIVTVQGKAIDILDEEGKRRGLRAVLEQIAPGSWDYARRPDAEELAAAAVLALDLSAARVAVRTGGPCDRLEDIAAQEVWAGELPVARPGWGTPIPAADLGAELAVPAHIRDR
ncbi:pyridoxamine 5'-phosphate oxidase family protein [Nocardia nova]|uniref:pyridoxamine 5'-phosphate oxidase family protein n=1 Tax=Nocardia nova TaxID=37330 RepID=UPI0037ACF266